MNASVLINNFNYAHFLPEAIQSISLQTHPVSEIIIVDDGSKDNSLEVLEDLKQTVPNLKVIAQENGGQLSAMRAAIKASTGDWCFFLDADDSWLPSHIANAAAAIEKHPETGVWYSGHKESDGAPVFRGKWPGGSAGPFAALVSATGVRIGTITSTVALSRQAADEIVALPSELNDDWRIRADDVLLYNAAFSGKIFHYTPEPTTNYRIHANNSFAHQDKREESYRENKKRLFAACAKAYGLDTSKHLELLRDELLSYPPERTSHEATRRYRRAIRRLEAPFSKKVKAYISTFRK